VVRLIVALVASLLICVVAWLRQAK